jgi:hypothetical protein
VLNTDQRQRITIRSVDQAVFASVALRFQMLVLIRLDVIGLLRAMKNLGRLLRSSFERTNKRLAGDERLSQALSFYYYLIAFPPCK